MKKVALFFATWAIFGMIFFGCAAMKQAKVDFSTCWNDPVCREEAQAKAEDISGKAAAVAVVSPIPGTAAVAKPAVAAVALIVALISGGRAIRKREEE